MGYGLAAHARERPEKPALVQGERVLTYGEFDSRASRLANVLRSGGVGTGDRVGLMLRNGTEYFETTHAAGKIGATVVPINFHFRREEIEYILDDSGAKTLVFDAAFAEEVDGIG
ncbi:MAG: AMP-binding protein, partial [Candidatus Binatia bacterium]